MSRIDVPTYADMPAPTEDELRLAYEVGALTLYALHEKVGDFGTLLYCGKDWAEASLGRRSMELMAEKVMPAFR